ncbi:MAG: methyltransferase domain-containing protein [Deltaproteobacteria bacterium]|nr:methyltransferase domain-containing protein [Deltaproteobacteria bacterium]
MHKFDPRHLERLLSEERFKNISPERVLREAGLKEGDTMADIGCGPGFFSMPAAEIVGRSGRVYAADTQQGMLEYFKDKRVPPPNVDLLLSGEYSIPIADSASDFTLLAYVLHEAERKDLFLDEIKRITRPGGALLVIDWEKRVEESGPPVEERLDTDEAACLIERAGFSGVEVSSLNDSHYRILARRRQ